LRCRIARESDNELAQARELVSIDDPGSPRKRAERPEQSIAG
jgi:hypothetical protein